MAGTQKLGGGFKDFWNFHPENWGRWSNLTNIFQRGWDHQLEKALDFLEWQQREQWSDKKKKKQKGPDSSLAPSNVWCKYITKALTLTWEGMLGGIRIFFQNTTNRLSETKPREQQKNMNKRPYSESSQNPLKSFHGYKVHLRIISKNAADKSCFFCLKIIWLTRKALHISLACLLSHPICAKESCQTSEPGEKLPKIMPKPVGYAAKTEGQVGW